MIYFIKRKLRSLRILCALCGFKPRYVSASHALFENNTTILSFFRAGRTLGVGRDLDLVELHVFAVVDEQPVLQRGADARQDFYRLGHLYEADNARCRAQHREGLYRWRLREDALEARR